MTVIANNKLFNSLSLNVRQSQPYNYTIKGLIERHAITKVVDIIDGAAAAACAYQLSELRMPWELTLSHIGCYEPPWSLFIYMQSIQRMFKK